MDIVGPLPPSQEGYLYIMVVRCYFSKWAEAYCLNDHTAETCAETLLSQWICRFGVPTEIITDQGPEFELHLFHHLCQDLGRARYC